ncbi:family 2 encapsulin nanocompartment cargo protein polyprenyl transferase [Nocardiopsis mangrovi]|uniref:Family 2 encapsulin nanocompartment cargo protein polyprenyl transferase n=1 Tax=Nocardiopsis mangrovi TaxID=1179818 RepID=A0ABV9DWS7_9ACTN
METIEEATGGRSAAEVLAGTRRAVGPALRAAVDTLPEPSRRIAAYHFGWRDENGVPTDAGSGKAIRPALVLLAAEAAGGRVERAMPAAVAVELVHNFSLLHDDVMDGDATRRHRRTAWSVFGVGGAILTGDALLALAFDVIAASGHPAAQDGARRLSAAVQRLVEGQSADMSFEARPQVGMAEWRDMAEAKTGALLECACALGASFGGGDSVQVAHLGAFGKSMGLAFQIVDDLLGIWGDPETTGKPVHSDLRNRKKSLPVVAALAAGTPAAEELARLYHGGPEPTEDEVARAADLVEAAGGRDWAETQADTLLATALEELRAAGPPRRTEAELAELARLATRRDH